jgi:DNA-binding MltR family transcriptional regulator
LLQSATDLVTLNGTNIEPLVEIEDNLELQENSIDFTSAEISAPVINIECASKMTVGLVQQGRGFSMAAIFSS